jgi:hypothetical protein
MKRRLIAVCAATAAVLTVAVAANTLAPGSRTLILSHNAYPDHGKFADRLDRSLAVLPAIIEQDLSWVDGKSLMIHGAKNVASDDPSLETYFFPKVRPIVEKALKDGNKGNWPLITLYLDIKNDPLEHLEAINKLLDKYDAWLTKAQKTADIAKQSPLELKPMMVIVEDKGNGDIKQKFFYDNVPVGGKIRVFGSPDKFDENPTKLPREKKDEAVDLMATRDLEQLVTKKADNYHRWFGTNWAFIEKGGETRAGEWTKESEARLKKFVDYGHKLGYLVGFYCLNGYTAAEDQGWDKSYNFGSKDKVMPRWQAAVRAHADFISTDQVEEVAKVVKATH